MTNKQLERLIYLLKELQYEVEDNDKEGGRVLGRAKDYARIVLARNVGDL